MNDSVILKWLLGLAGAVLVAQGGWTFHTNATVAVLKSKLHGMERDHQEIKKLMNAILRGLAELKR